LSPYRAALNDPTGLFQNHERIKSLANQHKPKALVPVMPEVEEGETLQLPEDIERKKPVGLYQGPRHIGMRRHIAEDAINEELQA
jgi:ribosomal protein S13